MKKTYYLVALLLLSFAFASCGDDESLDGIEMPDIPTSLLDLSPSALDFTAEEGTQTVLVTTSSNEIVVTEDLSWCTTTIDGKAITVTVISNEGVLRNGHITVKSAGLERLIDVTQIGTGKQILITPKLFTPTAFTEIISVKVTANVECTPTIAEEDRSWIKFKDFDITVPGFYTFEITTNSGEARESLISFKETNGSVEEFVTVRQEAYIKRLSLSPASLESPSAGATHKVIITRSSDVIAVSVPPAAPWCKVSIKGEELTVTTERHTLSSPRDTKVSVTCDGLTEELIVKQLGHKPSIELDPTEVVIPALGGGVIVNVTATTYEFTATSAHIWCSPIVSLEDKTINVSTGLQNPDLEPRTTTVTVQADGVTKTIKVTQEGKEPIKEVLTVTSVTASSQQPGEEVKYLIDGDTTNTNKYHSLWGANAMPCSIDFFFYDSNDGVPTDVASQPSISELIYYPLGGNGNFQAFTVYVKTVDQPSQQEVGTYAIPAGRLYKTEIEFEQTYVGVTEMKVIVTSGVGNFASGREIEFITYK